jgi:antitoxin VapB
MALNIKNSAVEQLASEIAAMTGESKTEAIRQALLERRERLRYRFASLNRGEMLQTFLEREVWPRVPKQLLGKKLSQKEKEEILGYGSDGV